MHLLKETAKPVSRSRKRRKVEALPMPGANQILVVDSTTQLFQPQASNNDQEAEEAKHLHRQNRNKSKPKPV